MNMRNRGYTHSYVCAILEIGFKTLRELRNRGEFPFFTTEEGKIYYDKGYVDGLAAKTRVSSDKDFRYDPTLFKLWYLKFKYDSCPKGLTHRRTADYRARVKTKCHALIASGDAVPLSQLAESLGGLFRKKDTFSVWARENRVACVRIGHLYYLSRRHFNYIVWLFTECETVNEIALRFNKDKATVEKWVRQGKITGIRCPDGITRFPPRTSNPLAVAPGLTLRETAKRLNVSYVTLVNRISEGIVTSTGNYHTRRIPEAEVAFWEKRFKSLNDGFGWLESRNTTGARLYTLSTRQTAHSLNVKEVTLTTWGKENLLPYFTKSFSRDSVPPQERGFVKLYIYGLRNFAKGSKVTKRDAIQYRQLCTEAQNIL